MRAFIYQSITVLLTGIGTLWASSAPAVLISEYQPDIPGLPPLTTQSEFSGVAGMPFRGFLLAIRGEVGSYGLVDRALSIDGTFDSNGIYVFDHRPFLNPTLTVALVDDFTGQAGVTDLDGDDDGIIDNLASISNVRDAIGITDSSDTQNNLTYGQQLGGADFAFTGDEPRLVFRDASVGDWYAINSPDNGQIFNLNGRDIAGDVSFSGDAFSPSIGQINPTAVPEPTSMAGLGSLCVVAVGWFRRRKNTTPVVSSC
ncbi:PEP-CTERM sorting domain-containing protein [Crateriforma spongiae]|uniref:PEP-CTERM sorting domain-containing protein n=1 Tax=Crateriforma spongiae TaxID=2724528 RepID=UPI0014462EA1|nr:PEP-CTERM sorting domain-containing protein [Crateriforma spongiae]